jgi:galactokinase
LELIGNHVDYNGGLVLAGAIDRVVAIAAGGQTEAGDIELTAGDVSTHIHRISIEACRDWRNDSGNSGPREYTCGVIAALLASDRNVRSGMQLSIAGNVPLGFGMSSSAALCVALVMTLSPAPLDKREVVLVAREAEHRCGSPVGAMDQSASVAGGIILFDGATTTFTSMQPDLANYVFAVADSGVRHALGESSYPIRVRESQDALTWLQNYVSDDLGAIGELAPDVWAGVSPEARADLGPMLERRVDHVVGEVDRVRKAVVAIDQSDWTAFGSLMTESGRSSDINYEISNPKVEELVQLLLAQDGVAGARMMGGGEGGPALALIHRDALPKVASALEVGFFRHNPSHLDGDRLQVCVFGPGARMS